MKAISELFNKIEISCLKFWYQIEAKRVFYQSQKKNLSGTVRKLLLLKNVEFFNFFNLELSHNESS